MKPASDVRSRRQPVENCATYLASVSSKWDMLQRIFEYGNADFKYLIFFHIFDWCLQMLDSASSMWRRLEIFEPLFHTIGKHLESGNYMAYFRNLLQTQILTYLTPASKHEPAGSEQLRPAWSMWIRRQQAEASFTWLSMYSNIPSNIRKMLQVKVLTRCYTHLEFASNMWSRPQKWDTYSNI